VSGSLIRSVLEAEARRQLAGVGDAALGEWEEYGSRAFHLRRRLTTAEQRMTGPTRDIRGTAEARERYARMDPRLAATVPARVLAEELGT
jgi:hypothetical protein